MSDGMSKAKLALRMLTEGMSIRATERTTGIHRDTPCKLIVLFGTACRRFLEARMHGLKLTHLQFDEQWTFVAKKQSRLTIEEKATCRDVGDIYLWTCVDQQTKLMPSFLIGKRSADNARRFLSNCQSDSPSQLRTPAMPTHSRKVDIGAEGRLFFQLDGAGQGVGMFAARLAPIATALDPLAASVHGGVGEQDDAAGARCPVSVSRTRSRDDVLFCGNRHGFDDETTTQGEVLSL